MLGFGKGGYMYQGTWGMAPIRRDKMIAGWVGPPRIGSELVKAEL